MLIALLMLLLSLLIDYCFTRYAMPDAAAPARHAVRFFARHAALPLSLR